MDNSLAELRRRATVAEFIETVGVEVIPGLIAQQGPMVAAEALAAFATQFRATVESHNAALDNLAGQLAKSNKRVAKLEAEVAEMRSSNKAN